jgi:hypothetical protein
VADENSPTSGPLSASAQTDNACSTVGCPGPEILRRRLEETLLAQGFNTESSRRGCAHTFDKQTIRQLNRQAVAARKERARGGLERHEDKLIARFAEGNEVDPRHIRPRLVEVHKNTDEELLFRYAVLHWSIPVSAGYGRRLRFLVFDDNNDKLIGLFGLGDPVFAIGPRDNWVGWSKEARGRRLRNVMEAFALGAVPPYNDLLCGKLVALLTTCDEVRQAFSEKYAGHRGIISDESFSGELAMLTTASALGRSSVYNRLSFKTSRAFVSVGYTAGSGDFHFANSMYGEILAFANHHCLPTSKNRAWGSGWRNRREVIRSVLSVLGLPLDLVYHGVQRELFVAPLASNTQQFLRSDTDKLSALDRPAKDVFEWFQDRWLVKRAATVDRYRSFNRESLRLWGG